MMFTLFDISILTIFIISSLLGLYKGIINITINLLGFVASIIAAIILYPYTRLVFADYITNELVASIISGIVSYIVSLMVFTFLTTKVVLLFDGIGRGSFDRFLGFIVGIIRGGLFVLIIFAIVAIFTAGTYSGAKKTEDLINKLSSDEYPAWLKDSITTPYLEKILKTSMSFVPEEVWDYIKIPEKEEEEDIIEAIKKRKNRDKKPTLGFGLDKENDN